MKRALNHWRTGFAAALAVHAVAGAGLFCSWQADRRASAAVGAVESIVEFHVVCEPVRPAEPMPVQPEPRADEPDLERPPPIPHPPPPIRDPVEPPPAVPDPPVPVAETAPPPEPSAPAVVPAPPPPPCRPPSPTSAVAPPRDLPPPAPVREHAAAESVSGETEIRATPVALTQIRPFYPYGARRRGEEGLVVVSVWVDVSGRTDRAEVMESSGFASLDSAALQAVRRARFRPAGTDGQPVAASAEVRLRFKLTGEE